VAFERLLGELARIWKAIACVDTPKSARFECLCGPDLPEDKREPTSEVPAQWFRVEQAVGGLTA
jgi:hypothetical protein